eukprot:scaffold4607_cov39-Cyclotella_meneghiniana.AAC.4
MEECMNTLCTRYVNLEREPCGCSLACFNPISADLNDSFNANASNTFNVSTLDVYNSIASNL